MKPETNFGRWKGTTFIVITSNLEFSSTCRRKNHSQDHCDTLTWSGQHTRPWTWCKKAEKDNSWNIDGESKPIGTVDPFHAVHGTVLNEKPPDRYMWSRERLAKFSQPQGLIIRGQEFRPECQKAAQRKEKQQKAIEIRESREECTLLIRMISSSRNFFKKKKKMELPMEAAIS